MMFLVSLFVLLHSLGKSTVYCLLRASTLGDEKIGESDKGSKSSNVGDAGGEGNVCDVYEIIAELRCLACPACELCKKKLIAGRGTTALYVSANSDSITAKLKAIAIIGGHRGY
jgi:hypothetical protein